MKINSLQLSRIKPLKLFLKTEEFCGLELLAQNVHDVAEKTLEYDLTLIGVDDLFVDLIKNSPFSSNFAYEIIKNPSNPYSFILETKSLSFEEMKTLGYALRKEYK